MSVVVLVSEHILMSGNRVFAETSATVFQSPPQSPRQMLDLGNRVRHYRAIELSDWETYDKDSDRLPTEYLDAVM